MITKQRKTVPVLLSDLKPSPKNPRSLGEPDDALRALAASIKRLGVLQPILARPSGEVLAGHRRLAAARLAGLEKIPVIFLECADSERPEVFIAENLHRQDLLPLEVAGVLNEMKRELPISKVAEITSISAGSVRRYLSLLTLPAEIWPLIDSGQLSISAAELIAENVPVESQVYLAGLAVSERLTMAQLRDRLGVKVPKNKGIVHLGYETSFDGIIHFSVASLEAIAERLRSTPRFMDYADEADAFAERLRDALKTSEHSKAERILLTAESEEELQAKRVKAEQQGFKALGAIQINHETEDVYLRMTKAS